LIYKSIALFIYLDEDVDLCTLIAVLVNVKIELAKILTKDSVDDSGTPYTEKTRKYVTALEYEMFKVRGKWFLESEAVKIAIYIHPAVHHLYKKIFNENTKEYKQVS
jgi:hypothetical protein